MSKEGFELSEIKWINFPDAKFVVNGLAWFAENSPRLWRLPRRLKAKVRPEVWELAVMPSGGRIRFASDTTSLAIRASYTALDKWHNMCKIGQAGIALYMDGRFWKPVWPEKTGRQELTFFKGAPRAMRDCTLYLPLGHAVELLALGFDTKAKIKPPAPFAVERPVVFYGTSITQGGCASQAGTSYQAILGRALNVDFINLGFSGEGRGEPELAHAVAQIDASAFVLDFAQNCPTVEELAARYGPFIDTIRAARPDAPIICITPIFATRNLFSKDARARFDELAAVIRRAAAARIAAGDRNIRCVEGLSLLSPADADGFVDGVHPNDLGFAREASVLGPIVADALGLS